MYRNSAQGYSQVQCIPRNTLPSPDNTSDSDCDIIDALDEKRRQLDEEIARFKAAKDREFREFEKELRYKRRRSRATPYPDSDSTPTKHFSSTSSATASVLNLLASAQNGAVNGRAGSKGRRDGPSTDKVKIVAPLSGPTLSLDKLNIAGKTTPPPHSLSTSPPLALVKRSRSRSPANPNSRPITPPLSQSEKEPLPLSTPTPTPSKDQSDPFAGVFTAAYLPLLESPGQSAVRSPPPLSTSEEEEKRLQLDADSKEQAGRQRLESSQSLPPQHLSPALVPTKRADSTPALPSTSLPSALRSVSGGERARKHVMFQLADLKVVDPSSSYEEGPSPELEERDELNQHGLRVASSETGSEAPSRKSKRSSRLQAEKDKKSRRGKSGRFISPIPSPLPSPRSSPMPSPLFRGQSPLPSPTPSQHRNGNSDGVGLGLHGDLQGADDGGSGVGFFELDEELASPGLRDGKAVDKFDVELGEDLASEKGANGLGLGLGSVPSFKVGSVPIDIVKPSSSFVGSYGH